VFVRMVIGFLIEFIFSPCLEYCRKVL